MSGQFILRFDDICPTMNWTVWHRVEELLSHHKVFPLLAVVPENKDSELRVETENPNFWDCVRRWQSRGWTIGLHGYQHRYVTTDPGIMGKNNYSEFAGLPPLVQEEKLKQAIKIFSRERITPDIFVAPAHSFDRTTIECLLRCGIRSLSDGYAVLPHVDAAGMTWLPQQLWELQSRPFGIWSVCFHINRWNLEDLNKFEKSIQAFAGRFTTVPDVLGQFSSRSVSFTDRIHEMYLRSRILSSRSVREILHSFRRTTVPSAVNR